MPPPPKAALLPEKVLLVTVSVPSLLKTAAAVRRAVTRERAIGDVSVLPLLKIPPPVSRAVAREDAVGDRQRALVLNAAAVGRSAVGNRQVIQVKRGARVHLQHLIRVGAVDGDGLAAAVNRQTD